MSIPWFRGKKSKFDKNGELVPSAGEWVEGFCVAEVDQPVHLHKEGQRFNIDKIQALPVLRLTIRTLQDTTWTVEENTLSEDLYKEDIYGKELFDGDIVKLFTDGHYDHKYLILFVQKDPIRCSYNLVAYDSLQCSQGDIKIGFDEVARLGSNFEIIGNVWDTPQYLEAEWIEKNRN